MLVRFNFFASKLSFLSMQLLFCTKILNSLILIQPKIIIRVGKLKKIWKFLPKFLIFLKFRTEKGTVAASITVLYYLGKNCKGNVKYGTVKRTRRYYETQHYSYKFTDSPLWNMVTAYWERQSRLFELFVSVFYAQYCANSLSVLQLHLELI